MVTKPSGTSLQGKGKLKVGRARVVKKKAKRDHASIQIEKPKRDHVSIQIDQMFSSSWPDQSSQLPKILRVHRRLRSENEDAYEPEIISIGPYHHGSSRLKPMEAHKIRFLKQLFSRKSADSFDKCVTAMRKLEVRARKCYEDTSVLDSNEFVKMMLLDSCFIIELFRKHKRQKSDPILQMDHVADAIFRDLKLLENQLPFFVLVEFMNKSRLNDDEEEDDDEGGAEGQEDAEGGGAEGDAGEDIIDMAFHALCIDRDQYQKPDVSLDEIEHLLDLLHRCWCSSFKQIRRVICGARAMADLNELEYIKPATELEEAGVQFKCADVLSINGRTVFNVGFVNGVMELPRLEIDERTEAIVRNLIAYEQYQPNSCERPVTDYYVLLDCLMNSSKDVEILHCCGIIQHGLGDDGVVSAMINKLTKQVGLSKLFSYLDVCYDVNEHCKRRRNVWMTNLKRTYFNTPWAWISFVAAVILLLLTVIQTLFGILSYVAP